MVGKYYIFSDKDLTTRKCLDGETGVGKEVELPIQVFEAKFKKTLKSTY